MKAKELAEKLLENPDFEVEFVHLEKDNSKWGMSLISFNNIKIDDIGYSDKVIQIGGSLL